MRHTSLANVSVKLQLQTEQNVKQPGAGEMLINDPKAVRGSFKYKSYILTLK